MYVCICTYIYIYIYIYIYTVTQVYIINFMFALSKYLNLPSFDLLLIERIRRLCQVAFCNMTVSDRYSLNFGV
jgi:hypothetical protein